MRITPDKSGGDIIPVTVSITQGANHETTNNPGVAKGTGSTNNMNSGTTGAGMQKEGMSKDGMSKDGMSSKDGMKNDTMSKDGMKK